MPVMAVYGPKGGLIGYRWGKKGKLYMVSVYGKGGARAKAARQGAAITARGGK